MPSFKNIGNAFKKASSAMTQGQYEIEGKQIRCPHCGGDNFAQAEAQLNTSVMTFLNLDWLNRSAIVLVCTRCSQIQWFGKIPTRMA